MNPAYYIWWVERSAGGQWHGYVLLDDETLWRYEYDVQRGTPDVRRMYRWVWDGQNWQYDERSAQALYFKAGEQRFAQAMFP